MPVEIKELHIRVSVNASPGGQPSGARTAVAGGSGVGSEDAKDAIVAECVEQVLHILRNKVER
jgi:hypothetical protein